MERGPGSPTYDVIVSPDGKEEKLPGRQLPGGRRLSRTDLVLREAVPKGTMAWSEFVWRGKM